MMINLLILQIGKKTMNVLAILQARMSSSRLPGKVMMEILGEPMISLQIERIKRAKKIDKLILATSNQEEDNKLEEVCKNIGLYCFRGSLDNVLDRYYNAALTFNPIHIVRLTGDCPLIDPKIIDEVIDYHISENSDFTSNAAPNQRLIPDGLDAEVIKFKILEKIRKKELSKEQKEHVTLYFYENLKEFNFKIYAHKGKDLSSHRWTVDYLEDFNFVEKIYSKLYHQKNDFNTEDILNLLEKNPHLTRKSNE